MDKLILNDIKVKNNRIDYLYTLEGKWNTMLSKKESLFIEYDMNVKDVPKSIQVIPFLSNILPISWIFNLEICLDQIDKEFYDSIENIKDGYPVKKSKNFSQ